MPRIDHTWSSSVFYLFRRDPRTGEIEDEPQGTGCFVLRPSKELPGLSHWYAVSNWHLTHQAGASIIRVNSWYDNHRMIELDPSEWAFDANGDDLSAVDITESLEGTAAENWYVFEPDFISRERYDDLMIDIGEDTMMAGLFASHSGGERNIPSVRFGNISMTPNEKALVEQLNGIKRPSYLVDTRSRGGYSGSPVFVYRTPDGDLRRGRRQHPTAIIMTRDNMLFALLGIHCGQFWEPAQVRKSRAAEAKGDVIHEGDVLRLQGGMTIVVPAWRISELLDRKEFEMQRKERDERRRPLWEKLPVPEAEPESAVPLASDENPTHVEDFTRLVDMAARKRKPDDRA
jgi:hypothetical protein